MNTFLDDLKKKFFEQIMTIVLALPVFGVAIEWIYENFANEDVGFQSIFYGFVSFYFTAPFLLFMVWYYFSGVKQNSQAEADSESKKSWVNRLSQHKILVSMGVLLLAFVISIACYRCEDWWFVLPPILLAIIVVTGAFYLAAKNKQSKAPIAASFLPIIWFIFLGIMIYSYGSDKCGPNNFINAFTFQRKVNTCKDEQKNAEKYKQESEQLSRLLWIKKTPTLTDSTTVFANVSDTVSSKLKDRKEFDTLYQSFHAKDSARISNMTLAQLQEYDYRMSNYFTKYVEYTNAVLKSVSKQSKAQLAALLKLVRIAGVVVFFAAICCLLFWRGNIIADTKPSDETTSTTTTTEKTTTEKKTLEDAKEEVTTTKEITTAKPKEEKDPRLQAIETFIVLFAILALPLLKQVEEEKINPEKPSTLFFQSCWYYPEFFGSAFIQTNTVNAQKIYEGQQTSTEEILKKLEANRLDAEMRFKEMDTTLATDFYLMGRFSPLFATTSQPVGNSIADKLVRINKYKSREP